MPSAAGFPAAFAASMLTALILIMTRDIHGVLSLDRCSGVQKVHKSPTLRVGGVAVMSGVVFGALRLPSESFYLLLLVVAAIIPCFGAGLAEDMTKCVGVKTRLLATMISGAIFVALTGYAITEVDILGIDWALGQWLPSLLFTAFAISGISNAANIIDGVNGLASGSALIILASFTIVAWQVEDIELQEISLVIIAAVIGFFALNFPFGLIFLGDAGAYAIGFLLATIAVMLPARNPELSPLIGLLALAYPVIETLTSIQRRRTRQRSSPGLPDRLHLHSLAYRDLARRLAKGLGKPQLRNPLAAVLVWPLPLLSGAMVVAFGTSTPMIWICFALVTVIYALFYRRVALLGSRRHRGSDSAVSQ